jgi:hypothetical protein
MYIRILLRESQEIVVRAPYSARPVTFEDVVPAFSRTIAYFAWKVEVSCRKYPAVIIVVDGFFREHDFIAVICENLVYGLSFADERADDSVKTQRFRLVDHYAAV